MTYLQCQFPSVLINQLLSTEAIVNFLVGGCVDGEIRTNSGVERLRDGVLLTGSFITLTSLNDLSLRRDPITGSGIGGAGGVA
jgi:hypothetical protein